MTIRITKWVDLDSLPMISRNSFDFLVTQLADGSWLTFPVEVAVGSRRRPRVVALAGIHGDEPDGMIALQDFWESCDPKKLKGTVIVVPVANTPAFAAHQRRSPWDSLDLNRIFPGKADGTPSERLAHVLVDSFVTGADFVFTLHSWFATGTVVPYVEFPEGDDAIAKQSRDAAVAAGFSCLREGRWPQGVLALAALEKGVPVLEAELGGQGTSTLENRERYISYFTRLLQHLGVLGGEPPPNPSAEIYGRNLIHAPVGGMLRLRVSPGDQVEPDAVLATITNLHGELIAVMRAPHAGLVAAVRRFASVNPGEVVFAFFPRISSPR